MTVVVASTAGGPSEAANPGFLAPVTPQGQPITSLPLMPGESLRWQPELAPEGPISAVVSRQSGRVIVSSFGRGDRAGARGVHSAPSPLGTHVLMLVEGAARTPQRHNLKRATQRWIEIEISGHADHAGEEPDAALDGRLQRYRRSSSSR